MYSHFDTFFKTTLGKHPIYLGMAVSLQIRIIQQLEKSFPIDLIKNIFNNPIFNIEEPKKILLPNILNLNHSLDQSYENLKQKLSTEQNEQNEQNEQSNEIDTIKESDSFTTRSLHDLPINCPEEQNKIQFPCLIQSYQPDLTTQMISWIQNIDSRLKSVEILTELLRIGKK